MHNLIKQSFASFEPRPYQVRAVFQILQKLSLPSASIDACTDANTDLPPIVCGVLPCAFGKSAVTVAIALYLAKTYPDTKNVIIVPKQCHHD